MSTIKDEDRKKLGKHLQLENYNNVKRTCETVNFVNYKSLSFSIENYIKIEDVYVDTRLINTIQRDIKKIIREYQCDEYYHTDVIIADVNCVNYDDNFDSSLVKRVYIYFGVDVQLYINKGIWKTPVTYTVVDDLTKKIINYLNESGFTFYDKEVARVENKKMREKC